MIVPTKDGDERKEKRRAANRRSARKSRYREMVMLDELQRNSRELSTKNSELKHENDSLRQMIMAIKKAKTEQRQLLGVSASPNARIMPYIQQGGNRSGLAIGAGVVQMPTTENPLNCMAPASLFPPATLSMSNHLSMTLPQQFLHLPLPLAPAGTALR